MTKKISYTNHEGEMKGYEKGKAGYGQDKVVDITFDDATGIATITFDKYFKKIKSSYMVYTEEISQGRVEFMSMKKD